jgi:hypothetical protein
MFTDDGGSFSKILQSTLSAENFLNAYTISRLVSAQVDRFKKLKRKWYTDEVERKKAYVHKLGSAVAPVFEELDAAIPQITVFGLSMLFEKHLVILKEKPEEFIARVGNDPSSIWSGFIELIASRKALNNSTSWSTLLKSGSFYRDAIEHLRSTWKPK